MPPSNAQKLPSLRLGIIIEPPYVEIVDGEYVGLHIKLARYFSSKLNTDLDFVQCPVARCLNLMEHGKIDMLIGMIKTEKRQQYMTYLPKPHRVQTVPIQFFVNRNSDVVINTYEDLQGLNIGVVRGIYYFDKFDYDTKLNKIKLKNFQQMINMLLKGRINTFIEREESIIPWIDKDLYRSNIRLAKYQYSKAVDSYVTISKNSPYNQQIEELYEIQEMYKKELNTTKNSIK